MELIVNRKWKRDTYTISNLTINGKWFCNILEDKDRGLNSNMSESQIKLKKVPNKTAIPTGIYEVTLNVVSPKYSKRAFYITNANGGRVPRLLNVKGFDGILIHAGNTDSDSSGCLLVGMNKVKGRVINSQETFKSLYKKLKEASDRKEKITIKIL